jgi:glycosyltransferase involved in cell wall biosynthesis
VEVPLSVGLVFAGDAFDAGAWSGIPAGLSGGLASLPTNVVHVNADLRPWCVPVVLNALAAGQLARSARTLLSGPTDSIHQARGLARASPTLGALRTRALNRRLRAEPPPDAIVQLHSEFEVIVGAPLATYDDLTIAQALRHGYAELVGLSRRAQQRRLSLQQRVYRRAHACCTTTHWVKDSIVADYGIPADKVHVVGIATERRGHLDDEDGRDWSVPRFLFVGWDWERKNGDAVVRAFTRLRQTVPGAELHLVGGHPRISANGVVTHGPLHLDSTRQRAEVDDLFRRATCYVMPSRIEPSAIAYVEAATFGLPSIGTVIGGSAEIIGGGGLVIDPSDDEALHAAMAELCEPERAAALGALAHQRSHLYTWPAVAARIMTALGMAGFSSPALAPPI